MNNILKSKEFISLIGIIIVILILFVSRETINNNSSEKLKENVNSLQITLEEKDGVIAILTEDKERLEEELGTTLEELEDTEDEFDKLNRKTEEIIELISTDEELLPKYSKVFFLNEHYTPEKVSEIDEGTDEHSNLWDRICGNI